VTAQYAYYADNRLHTLANMINSTYLSTFNYAYDGSPSYALSSPGYGSGGEIAYELSGYDTFGRFISARNDLRTATYAYNAMRRMITIRLYNHPEPYIDRFRVVVLVAIIYYSRLRSRQIICTLYIVR